MKKLLITISLGLIVALAACSGQPQPTAPNNNANSTEPSGDIPQAYADLLQRFQQGEHLYEIEQPSGPVTIDPVDSTWDAYMVTLAWGSFMPDSTVAMPPVDWSGTLTFTGAGTFAEVFPIQFEPGQDSLAPFTVPVHQLKWHSLTANDIDGLHMLIFVDPNAATLVIPELQFETTPVQFKYTLDELARLRAFHPFGFGGVAVQAMKLPRPGCPHGRMVGHWVRDSLDHSRGHFGGLWINHLGTPFGAFKGRFWTADDGTGHFEGMVLNHRGVEIGKMAGHWLYDDPGLCPLCGDRHGRFEGRFELDSGRTGKLGGEFGDLTHPNSPPCLRLRGRWEMDCPRTDSSPL